MRAASAVLTVLLVLQVMATALPASLVLAVAQPVLPPARGLPSEGSQCSWGLPLHHANLTAVVEREAYINYSLVLVEDKIILNATGKAELKCFLYGVPLSWSEGIGLEFLYLSVNGSEVSEPWDREIRIGDLGFRGFLLNLTEPVELKENQTAALTVEAVLKGPLSFLAADRYEVQVPMYPCTSFFISNMSFKFKLPRGALISALEPGVLEREDNKLVYYSEANVTEFTSEVATIRFRMPEPMFLLDCPYAKRTLELDPLIGIKVSDEYELVNRAGPHMEKIKLLLPKEARHISARDPVGVLDISTKEKKSFKEVTVSLRSSINKGESLSLTVSYVLPWSSWTEKKGISNFELALRASEGLCWTVDRMFLKIVLPMGASLKTSSPRPDELTKRFFYQEVGFILSPVIPGYGQRIKVEFSYSPFWPSFWPTLWASMAGLVACLVIKAIGPAGPALPAVAIPADKVLRFVEVYERRTRLRNELSALREALREKKISRRKFKTRSKAIGDELARLDREISALVPELREVGGLVSELVRDLEVAESELNSVERDMRSLEVRYRRKEISSEAYRRLLREYRRREDRARTAIREALLRLRELVS